MNSKQTPSPTPSRATLRGSDGREGEGQGRNRGQQPDEGSPREADGVAQGTAPEATGGAEARDRREAVSHRPVDRVSRP